MYCMNLEVSHCRSIARSAIKHHSLNKHPNPRNLIRSKSACILHRQSSTSTQLLYQAASSLHTAAKMSVPFDYAPDRPDHIENILNGLDRYNPETTSVFQDYVQQQCEDRTYDCYANLALLKL